MPSLLFPLSVFLSASLLFLLEPMFARMILPRLGGAPAVWNTCVVFYQVALLGGYTYAHLLTSRLRPRAQAAVHLTLTLAAAAFLPIVTAPGWTPPSSENPSWAVFLLLLRALGLPFFVLAASGPLLQRWFLTAKGAARNPYALYAASNAGSLVALLAYPFVIEPLLRLHQQSVMWAFGYAAYIAFAALCALQISRSTAMAAPAVATERPEPQERDAVWAARLEWLALSLVPASLMLSVTTFISVDIAAIPLLWIAPLATYLVTLVIAFADRRLVPKWFVELGLPVAVIAIVMLALGGNSVLRVRYVVPAHMLAFAMVALACHVALADRRPPAERLTEFYLWIAAGGAAGGIFNTLVAPHLFVTPIEYPLTAIATCLLFPTLQGAATTAKERAVRAATTLLPAALLIGLTIGIRLLGSGMPSSVLVRYALAGGPALVACLALWRSPMRMGIALATVFLAGSFLQNNDRVTLHVERTFFGVHRVTFDGYDRILMSGTTNHGAQSIKPDLKCEPLTYYPRRSPVGRLFTTAAESPQARFGVVGLGTASMAAYARPGQSWTFFEINPAIERLARDADYFTYLRDCAPAATVVLGDARLSLERMADGSFDVLVLDAFSSDAIPVHLLTEEAIDMYFRKLAPAGVLAVHISNRYLDLAPVVRTIADARGYAARVQHFIPDDEDYAVSGQMSTNRWIAVARTETDIERMATGPGWERLPASRDVLWTDDYSNVVGVLH